MTREDADLAPAVPPDEDLEDLALTEDYALNPAFVEMVVDAADRDDNARLTELLAALHPADLADLMGFLPQDYREHLLPLVDPLTLAELISELESPIREEVLRALPASALAKALEGLDSDDIVDVVEDLDARSRAEVLAAMPEAERAAVESSLAYEDETAGRLMQREVLRAPSYFTVGQTIDYIHEAAEDLPELFFDVYVVDPSFRPVGAVPVSALLRAARETALTAIMEPASEIPVDMDQEEVAYIFDKYHLISAPVVEPGGRLVGQITVDDIVGVIREEAEEDILALAGVSDAGQGASVLGVVRARLPWLVINMFTAVVAVSSIALFQEQIAQVVALAVIMPIVSSLGGNAGTQTLAVAVRALASRELSAANAARVVRREIGVGLTNGVVLSLLLGGAVMLFYHDPRLAVTAGLALVANIFIAAVGGIIAPLALDRMGRDPAVSSSIFVTFLTDSMGFLAVLLIASLILL